MRQLGVVGVVAVLALWGAKPAQGQEAAVDVTGTWELTLEFDPPYGPEIWIVTLEQDGDSLTGSILDRGGVQTGWVEGNELFFTFEGSLPTHTLEGRLSPTPYELTFRGVVRGDRAAGWMNRPDLFGGGLKTEIPWTAKKQ